LFLSFLAFLQNLSVVCDASKKDISDFRMNSGKSATSKTAGFEQKIKFLQKNRVISRQFETHLF
jgi:hypothetical protein